VDQHEPTQPLPGDRSCRSARAACARWLRVLALLATIAPVLAATLTALAPGSAAGQTSECLVSREYPLKAAYLYNFANYVEWPASAFPAADSPFTIGVLGSDPFGTVLDELAATKKVRDRRIVILRFSRAEQVKDCQILFIAATVSKPQRAEALARLAHAPVLVICDSGAEIGLGGMIHFVNENNRIRFTVNARLARQADLKISSKILALAKSVSDQ
jgi:hypothetical protein